MSSVLEVKNLEFTYLEGNHKALDGINFAVEEGEFFSIIGQNESGKSSLCNALVGLIPHFFHGDFSGDVFVFGENTRDSNVAGLASKIGLVFQNPFNQLSYTTMTVAEELAYGLGNLGVPRDEMQRRVTDVAELMHITHLLEKNPLELSGGQVQRVAIGSAFVMQPKILVLDECTTQLDPLGSEEVFDVVKDLNARGITVVMADHDMERVARYADHVLVLHQNKQIACGTTREIFTNIDLAQYNLEAPDYVTLTREFQKRGWWNGALALTQEQAIEAAKEVLAK